MSRTSAAGDVKRLHLKLLRRLLDIPTAKSAAPRGHRRVLTKAPLLNKRGESLDEALLQVAFRFVVFFEMEQCFLLQVGPRRLF
jgi:hypothetical protein